MPLTLITCTADRPEAFELCERWMARQTYTGELQWIVSDGGKRPVECHHGQEHLQNGDRWNGQRPKRNFRNNMMRALEQARHDKILFIEDDDWYHPDYLAQASGWLDHAELVGEARAKYYNVATNRYKICGNRRHASLCQTGIRGDLVPLLINRIKQHSTAFVDLHLWKTWAADRSKLLRPESQLSVGIKGIPGRGGIGAGHRLQEKHARDADWSVLRQWIGEDADVYQNLVGHTEKQETIA
jgi:glycosyltransferase involved in cell wall biosynthesis